MKAHFVKNNISFCTTGLSQKLIYLMVYTNISAEPETRYSWFGLKKFNGNSNNIWYRKQQWLGILQSRKLFWWNTHASL